MPTSHPRHSITETPALAAVLEPLRRRLGDKTPTLTELVVRGAEVTLREEEARDRARTHALATFADRLRAAGQADLEEFEAIRHASREP